LGQFAHPGDRCYRHGLVAFEEGQQPEFETIWELFAFYDPDESGHLSEVEFQLLWDRIGPETSVESFEEAWSGSTGAEHGHINFSTFVRWAESAGLQWPVGISLDGRDSGRVPCRFAFGDRRCPCEDWDPDGDKPYCKCGHKRSCHRSELADQRFEEMQVVPPWDGEDIGLVPVEEDADVFGELQQLLDTTHKTTDNWTRDRGCAEHGVNNCPTASCAYKNRAPVPTGYKLVRAQRNQNRDLWVKYALARQAIEEDCARENVVEFALHIVESCTDLDHPLSTECNEWRVFHGSSHGACIGICGSNFRVSLAGTGATWKDPEKGKGTPLYGFGIYFAERITKADEYAEPVPEGEDEGLHNVLVCRVVAGRVNVVTTNAIDKEGLKKDVFQGPFHSVLGDRVVTLNKPYREVVVYDKDQVYPEFLLTYARSYESDRGSDCG